MMDEYDVVIIGGGPGGYTAAIKASELGLKTAMIEKGLIGGGCTHWGCIPVKAMLRFSKLVYKKSLQKTHDYIFDNVMTELMDIQETSNHIAKRQGERIEGILKGLNVDLYEGSAYISSNTEIQIQPSGEKLTGKNIIIATGSSPMEMENIKCDGESIINVKDALHLKSVPSSVIIVGAGATSAEFATIWNRFDVKVTMLESTPNVVPSADLELSNEALRHFAEAGIAVKTGVTVQSAAKTGDGVEVTYTDGGKIEKLTADKVFVSVGISPNSSGIGLEELGVKMENGFICVDQDMKTNISGIYAAGDVTGKKPLALVASLQGIVAVESIAGMKPDEVVYEHIAQCIYAGPEIASVGLTEETARAGGRSVAIVKKPVKDYRLGYTSEPANSGFVKLVVDAKDRKLLGAHIFGDDASEIIAGQAILVSSGAIIPEAFESIQN